MFDTSTKTIFHCGSCYPMQVSCFVSRQAIVYYIVQGIIHLLLDHCPRLFTLWSLGFLTLQQLMTMIETVTMYLTMHGDGGEGILQLRQCSLLYLILCVQTERERVRDRESMCKYCTCSVHYYLYVATCRPALIIWE